MDGKTAMAGVGNHDILAYFEGQTWNPWGKSSVNAFSDSPSSVDCIFGSR